MITREKIDAVKAKLGSTAFDIMAKEIPLENVDLAKKLCKSPFNPHDDHPSAHWFDEGNCLKDFSSHRTMDYIDFAMKNHNKSFNSAVKEMFVYPLRSAETKAVKQFTVIREKADVLKASLPRSSGKRIITYAISQEKGGAAVLKNEGITEIPKLTEKEMEVYNWMRKGFDVFHGLVNKRRLEAGMEPMGFIENYFTFSRELTLADALGFGFMDSAMNKYLHPKGTAFPHALKRKGGIEKIQLDVLS